MNLIACLFTFQVDAALGAEEMVEQLGEKKMALEDEVIDCFIHSIDF